MARFRAFDSDSGSSEDEGQENKSVVNEEEDEHVESEPEDESEDESEDIYVDEDDEESDSVESDSDSDDVMDEEELDRRPRRSRKALFQDDNGEFQVTREGDEDEDGSRSSSRLSPSGDYPTAGPSQTMIPWARHVGVDTQKMHVMQTSLFRMPEEAAALRALNNNGRPKAVTTLIAQPPINRKHSRDSDDGHRTDSRERASFAHDIHGSIPRPSRKYARVEVESTIINGQEGAYADAGLAFGRSFRVGWGPGGKLAHAGTICTPNASSVTSSTSSVVNITKTPFPSIETENDSPASISEKLLQHHLSQTPITRTESGVPIAIPTPHSNSLDFSSFASLFPTTDTSGPASLFRLGSALFDSLDLRLSKKPGAITPDVRARITLLRRRQALSEWLEHVVKLSVDGDIRVKATGLLPGAYTEVDTVFSALTGHQVDLACSMALDAKYFKLATLISQAGGDEVFKADIRAQLAIWKEDKLGPSVGGGGLGAGPNGLISRGVWKVYRLLSGPEDEASANWVDEVCAGLDWKRVFGLCLWYGLGVDAGVADVVRLYESLTRRYSPAMITRPLPTWQVELNQKSGAGRAVVPASLGSISRGPGGLSFASTSGASGSTTPRQPEDPLYSLIRLHADPTLSLSQILEPNSFGPNLSYGGVGMCWHLYIILSRVIQTRDFADRKTAASGASASVARHRRYASGDSTEASFPESGHSHTADALTSAYAFELEGWGMVQEAAFVLLHLENDEGRRKALKDLLARSAPQMDEWMTRGLVGSLKIPITWVHEAKAMHALSKADIFEAYELYVSAQLWNAAHDIAVLELAPDAILRRDVALLQELFEPFDLDGRRDKVEGWFVRGKVFVDYVHILNRLPQLQDTLLTERESHVVVAPPPGEPSTTEEIDELTRKIPKLIALLPDVLYRKREVDDRHAAAVEEMVQGLLSVMGKVKPAMMLKQPSLAFMDPSTKLALIRGKSYARFLQRVSSV